MGVKGNQFWKQRSKHGRKKLFETPELLLEAAKEYFQWCDDNPWSSEEITTTDKGNYFKSKPTPRPYSLMGFRSFVGASDNWLTEFKKNCSVDFLGVIDDIEQYIYTQQWEGATVGAFNSNIIARTLGLKDKSEHDHKNDGGAFPKILTAAEVVKRAKELDEEY